MSSSKPTAQMFLRGIPHLLSLIRPSQDDVSQFRHDVRGAPDSYAFVPLPIESQAPGSPRLSSPRLVHDPYPSRTTTASNFLQHLLVTRGAAPLTYSASPSTSLPPPMHAAPAVTRRRPASTDRVLGSDYKVSDICALHHLHQVRLECLSRARQVADAPPPTMPLQELAIHVKKDGKDESKPTKVQACPRADDKAKVKIPKKKRIRRKWLPPLGPPCSSANQPTVADNTTEWYLTNPEVFATLSESSNMATLSESSNMGSRSPSAK
jgi:hypothetical protein